MKLFLKLSFFILSYLCMQQMLLSSVAQCPSVVPKAYAAVQPGSVIAAYFGNWDVYGVNSYKIDHINPIADHIDYLVYGFMKPDDKTARCKPHDIWADIGAYDDFQTKVGGNFAKIRDLKAKYPKLKVLLSVGGGTYNKNLFLIAQDKDKLMHFAKSCVDMLDFYDHAYMSQDGIEHTNHLAYEGLFDGLDIDWEWTNAQMSDHMAVLYTQFMQELSRLLKLRDSKVGKKSMLTMALQVTPKIYQTLQLAKLSQLVDYIHVMAYDFYGPNSGVVGFNAPICS
ncbi:MAG: glycoside hydrolase family 18 protein, partial [Candidatus Chromulinivorax sp.]